MRFSTRIFIIFVFTLFWTGGFAADEKDKEKRLPEGCAAGEVAKWDEAVETWVCDGRVTTNASAIVDLEGRVGALEAGHNPLQVALLRWYEASEAGNDFQVGANPRGVAFDGANIWVANYGDSRVSKLRASDGKTLETSLVSRYKSNSFNCLSLT